METTPLDSERQFLCELIRQATRQRSGNQYGFSGHCLTHRQLAKVAKVSPVIVHRADDAIRNECFQRGVPAVSVLRRIADSFASAADELEAKAQVLRGLHRQYTKFQEGKAKTSAT